MDDGALGIHPLEGRREAWEGGHFSCAAGTTVPPQLTPRRISESRMACQDRLRLDQGDRSLYSFIEQLLVGATQGKNSFLGELVSL